MYDTTSYDRPMTGFGLTEVQVIGFRTLLDVSLRPRALNVMVGEANAGKSNVLGAIRALFDAAVARRDDLLRGDAQTLSISGRLADGSVLTTPTESPSATAKEGREAPSLLYFPSDLRSSTLVAHSATTAAPGLSAQRVLATALHEQLAGDPRASAASAAAGLLPGLERCCDEGLGGLIVLVEEPELYLRPQAQRYLYRILRELTNNGNQVFYTTHSPAFLNVARLEELTLVTRDPVAGTQVHQPQPLPASDAFRVMSEFDAERSEVFLANAAVLVEGRTEKLALPHVFAALGYDPDRAGISIIECGGKANMVMMAKVCSAVGIPFCAVHDRDAPAGSEPSMAERRLNAEIAHLAGTDHVIVLEPDFEGVSGLHRHSHKPEQAWRHFRDLTPDEMPPVLVRAAKLAAGLSAVQR